MEKSYPLLSLRSWKTYKYFWVKGLKWDKPCAYICEIECSVFMEGIKITAGFGNVGEQNGQLLTHSYLAFYAVLKMISLVRRGPGQLSAGCCRTRPRTAGEEAGLSWTWSPIYPICGRILGHCAALGRLQTRLWRPQSISYRRNVNK